MNRSSFAFFVALLIHILLIMLIWFLINIIPEFKKPEKEKKIKISLKELPPKKIPAVVPENKQLPPEKLPTIPKGEQLKKITKAPLLKYNQKAKPKETELNIQKKIEALKKEIEKIKSQISEKEYIELQKPKEKVIVKEEKHDSLSWAYEDKAQSEDKTKIKKSDAGATAGKDIKKLYGADWDKLSPGEQKYIIDNKEIMRRITQEVLNRQARVTDINDLNVNRVNIVEFYLHPNGDMSDFRFLKQSGYFILDDVTKATIEYAYSKYPRPEQTTLIRYNVYYNLKYR